MPALIRSDLRFAKGYGNVIMLVIEGDPFPVIVPAEQVTRKDTKEIMSPTATKPGVKALRAKAKAAGIEGYRDMDRATLETAVAGLSSNGEGSEKPPAKKARKSKSTAKKPAAKSKAAAKEDAPKRRGRPPGSKNKTAAKTTKAAPKKAAAAKKTTTRKTSDNGDGPFREGSNMALITEELVKGGKRKDMIKRLNKKIKINPWKNDKKELDPVVEMDKRMTLAAHILKKDHGYKVEREGRGIEGTMKVVPPTKRGSKAKK